MRTRDLTRASHAALLLGAALFLSVGCAAPTRIAVPSNLPIQTNVDFFYFRWALEREAGQVRAVGLVETRVTSFSALTLELRGLDRDGRIVSRGVSAVRSGFGPGPQPFEVELRPGGQETRFELGVLTYEMNGLRASGK